MIDALLAYAALGAATGLLSLARSLAALAAAAAWLAGEGAP